MFTVAQVAEFLQMSKITVYDLIKTEKLKAYKIDHHVEYNS
ncbi:helix-turn-helix domain-containing protein [Bacillus sp. FSL K6-1005]